VAAAVSEDMNIVRQNVCEREETSPRFIHSGTTEGQFSEGVSQDVRDAVAGWLSERGNIQACVWTGLASNWKEKQKSDFSLEGALTYLGNLQKPERAREYLQKTPDQIQTAVRAAAREQLLWHDAVLSSALFAAVAD
jgi:hypothetical protein